MTQSETVADSDTASLGDGPKEGHIPALNSADDLDGKGPQEEDSGFHAPPPSSRASSAPHVPPLPATTAATTPCFGDHRGSVSAYRRLTGVDPAFAPGQSEPGISFF